MRAKAGEIGVGALKRTRRLAGLSGRRGSMGDVRRTELSDFVQASFTPRRILRLANAMWLAAAALAAAMLASYALNASPLAFREIVVNGDLKHLAHADVAARVRGWEGNFFTLDLARARRDIERIEWVRSASVAREWPSRLVIQATEHTPFARWGKSALVDAEGQVFRATLEAALPELSGPQDSVALVIERFRLLNGALAPLGLKVAALNLSPRHAWRATLDNGLALELGRSDIERRLATFIAAYNGGLDGLTLAGATVDLRYNRGLALKLAARATENSNN